MISIEVVNQVAASIMVWCSAGHPGYSVESVRECSITLNNCAVEGHGLTSDDNKLQACIAEARKELQRETNKK